MDGGIHAREWIAPAVATFLVQQLVEYEHEHPDLTQLLDWHFLPVMNPDGYRWSQGADRYWRKACVVYCLIECNWSYLYTDSGFLGETAAAVDPDRERALAGDGHLYGDGRQQELGLPLEHRRRLGRAL